MKRHGFGGQPASHGQSLMHRGMGSAGGSQGSGSRVLPGKRMPGNMGNESVTVKNLKVLHIDEKNGIVVVNGMSSVRRRGNETTNNTQDVSQALRTRSSAWRMLLGSHGRRVRCLSPNSRQVRFCPQPMPRTLLLLLPQLRKAFMPDAWNLVSYEIARGVSDCLGDTLG
jgi:hypothetical protein